jgi:hypothetical protein
MSMDYGGAGSGASTPRGILRNAFVPVPPLEAPGDVDLSADVDFASLVAAAEDDGGTHVHGPVAQGEFLGRMGPSALGVAAHRACGRRDAVATGGRGPPACGPRGDERRVQGPGANACDGTGQARPAGGLRGERRGRMGGQGGQRVHLRRVPHLRLTRNTAAPRRPRRAMEGATPRDD